MKKRKPDKPKERSFDRAEILLWGLALVVPTALWHTCAPTTIKGVLIGFLIGVAALVLCVRIAKGELCLPAAKPLVALVIAGFVWKIISALYGQRFYASSPLLLLAGVYFLVFLCTVALLRRQEQAIRLMLAAAYGAIPVAVIGIFEHYGIRFPTLVDNGLGRIYSTLGNPTFLAAYFALLLPTQICLFLVVERKAHRFGIGIVACLTSLCFIWTYSRGSWAGLAVALVTLGIVVCIGPAKEMVRDRGKPLAVLTAALAAVVAFAIISGPGVTSARKSTEESSRIGLRSSDSIRKTLMKAGLDMFRDHPILGVGLGGYSVRYSEYVVRKPIPGGYELGEEVAHNEAIQIAAEEGLPGLAIYLCMLGALVTCGIAGLRRAKAEGDKQTYLLISGLAAGLLAFGGDLMTNVAIRIVFVGIFWWMWAALLYVLSSPTGMEGVCHIFGKTPPQPSPKGEGAGFPSPKGEGAGFPSPKGEGAGFPSPKGEGAGFPSPKGEGAGFPSPKGEGAGFPFPKGKGVSSPSFRRGLGGGRTTAPIWRRTALYAVGLVALVMLVYMHIVPFVADMSTLRGVQAMSRGNPDGWVRGNEDALRIHSNAVVPLYYLGVAYIEAGYPEDALTALRRYNSRYPHGNSVDYELGRAYLRLSDYGKAVKFGELAARKDPSNPKVWQSLAASYCMVGDASKMEAAARKASLLTSNREMADEYKVPRHSRSPGLGDFLTAEELIRAQLYQQGISQLKAALEKEPRNAEFMTVLGATYWRIRETAKAEAVLKAAVAIDSGLIDAHGYLGALYLQSGRKAQAREELLRAISLKPDEQRLATFRQMLAQCE